MSRMMESNLFILHKSAIRYIAYASVAFVLFLILDLDLLAALAFGFIFFAAYVFRDPEKSLKDFEKNAFVSPVDGEVLDIEYLEDDAFAYKVTIASAYQDISILRVPYSAKVQNFTTVKGTRLAMSAELFEILNEYASYELMDDDGHIVKVVHRLSRSFAPLSLSIKESQEIIKGERYGVMLSGVTTIYLPKSFKLHLTARTTVSAGETLFGYLF